MADNKNKKTPKGKQISEVDGAESETEFVEAGDDSDQDESGEFELEELGPEEGDGATADDDEGSTMAPVDKTGKVAVEDDEDDDDDDDDVEEDLSAILQQKLTEQKESTPEDEEETTGDDRTDSTERLQPRQADEEHCSSCFLLVKQGAPGCPIENDECPIFVRV